jgi:hypothetical protein
MDEYEWGLLPAAAVIKAGREFIRAYTSGAVSNVAEGEPVNCLIGLFIETVNWIIKTSNMVD